MEPPRDRLEHTRQLRIWLRLGLLILIAGYVIAFAVANDEEASVDFVFAEATTSLIWVILLSLFAGLAGGVLLSQIYRRRQSTSSDASTETPSSISDGDA